MQQQMQHPLSQLPESPVPALRGRFNSRDLPRTYSGQYASGHHHDLLLPLECLQQEQFLQAKVSTSVFFCIYLSIIFALQFISTFIIITITTGAGYNNSSHQHHFGPPPLSPRPPLLFPLEQAAAAPQQALSWTLTNLIHLIFSLMTIHFSKGSFLVVNQQGELNAMTVWEQLEATPESSTHMRRTLLIVPTILCYIAICAVNFETTITMTNLCIWSIAMLPKLYFMNGVRLFGINRTAGIDDDDDVVDAEYCFFYDQQQQVQQQQQQQQLLQQQQQLQQQQLQPQPQPQILFSSMPDNDDDEPPHHDTTAAIVGTTVKWDGGGGIGAATTTTTSTTTRKKTQ
jgi:ORMDL family